MGPGAGGQGWEPGAWVLVLCDLGLVTAPLWTDLLIYQLMDSNYAFHQMDPCLGVSLVVPLAPCFLMSFSEDEAHGMTIFHQEMENLMVQN